MASKKGSGQYNPALGSNPGRAYPTKEDRGKAIVKETVLLRPSEMALWDTFYIEVTGSKKERVLVELVARDYQMALNRCRKLFRHIKKQRLRESTKEEFQDWAKVNKID